jgi:hypothetical protein
MVPHLNFATKILYAFLSSHAFPAHFHGFRIPYEKVKLSLCLSTSALGGGVKNILKYTSCVFYDSIQLLLMTIFSLSRVLSDIFPKCI